MNRLNWCGFLYEHIITAEISTAEMVPGLCPLQHISRLMETKILISKSTGQRCAVQNEKVKMEHSRLQIVNLICLALHIKKKKKSWWVGSEKNLTLPKARCIRS